MRKIAIVALSLAFASGLAPGGAFVASEAEAAMSQPTMKRPPKPKSGNGVCWHWSHGKWTAHPC